MNRDTDADTGTGTEIRRETSGQDLTCSCRFLKHDRVNSVDHCKTYCPHIKLLHGALTAVSHHEEARASCLRESIEVRRMVQIDCKLQLLCWNNLLVAFKLCSQLTSPDGSPPSSGFAIILEPTSPSQLEIPVTQVGVVDCLRPINQTASRPPDGIGSWVPMTKSYPTQREPVIRNSCSIILGIHIAVERNA